MISDDTFAFFDLNGDQSGNNETTYIQTKDYYERVNKRVLALIEDIIRKWDLAKLYRD